MVIGWQTCVLTLALPFQVVTGDEIIPPSNCVTSCGLVEA